MNLIVHIGPHKTGSTAIQRALVDNRAELARAGYYYPEIGFSEYGHHKLVENLATNSAGEVLDNMLAELNTCPGTLVLSSENFSLLSTNSIALLARRINIEDVKIVYYLRSLPDNAWAWWQELVKHGDKRHFLLFYAELMTYPFRIHIINVNGILAKWADHFGRDAVNIFRYEEIEDTALHFFKNVLNLNDVTTQAGFRINKSFSMSDTEFMRVINVNGKSGLYILRNNKHAEELAREIARQTSKYINQIDVDYESIIFRLIESKLQSEWSDNIITKRPLDKVFLNRFSRLHFVDPIFWAENPYFYSEVCRLASEY